MEKKVVYFETISADNTEITFSLVKDALKETGIKKIVLASTTGATALKAAEYFRGQDVQLIVIPHQYDFKRPQNPFSQERVKTLQEAGHQVHFGTMLFHTNELYGSTAPTIIANLLRSFSQGVKVGFEIVLMAADAGLAVPGEKVIAIAGTARGSDTALIMQAASSQNPSRLRVNEIICKPLNPLNTEK
ncbi:putative cytoplasmic protein [Syntrophobotulus glycolicus DSM 8271]|uniref:Cytoplasmic protein n=1 Tax=Syntrophobotulus glycolicus (strain DSM 8271 / FlGlyR) TaxID=645991 RepID=F0SXV0_SYNGF|nr:pyruvate kinase alpha/beta domain-containing protein [Syntrophobotulus glycolicus]ADY57011.1 putative cytoplasmic protein [Syntrophobotulus glycolicus DSM 8271]